MDLTLTGAILGIILFACVVPLTRHDMNAARSLRPEALPSSCGLPPRSYVGAMLALGPWSPSRRAVGLALALIVGIVLPLLLHFAHDGAQGAACAPASAPCPASYHLLTWCAAS